MIAHNLNALDLLSVPVWIVSPQSGEMIFANAVARELMQENTFSQLREGIFSTHAQRQLPDYIEDLRSRQDIVEILTVTRLNAHSALTCRLSLQQLPEAGDVILFEGFDTPAAQRLKASRSAAYHDPDIDGAKPTFNLFGGILRRIGLRHINADAKRFYAILFTCLTGFLKPLIISGNHRNIIPSLRETHGDGFSRPGATSGNHHYRHTDLPSQRRANGDRHE